MIKVYAFRDLGNISYSLDGDYADWAIEMSQEAWALYCETRAILRDMESVMALADREQIDFPVG